MEYVAPGLHDVLFASCYVLLAVFIIFIMYKYYHDYSPFQAVYYSNKQDVENKLEQSKLKHYVTIKAYKLLLYTKNLILLKNATQNHGRIHIVIACTITLLFIVIAICALVEIISGFFIISEDAAIFRLSGGDLLLVMVCLIVLSIFFIGTFALYWSRMGEEIKNEPLLKKHPAIKIKTLVVGCFILISVACSCYIGGFVLAAQPHVCMYDETNSKVILTIYDGNRLAIGHVESLYWEDANTIFKTDAEIEFTTLPEITANQDSLNGSAITLFKYITHGKIVFNRGRGSY